ncbi:hypothetical protein PCL_02280 [Purpureocillium lilacinum]|uniref:Uncharacterized protein n=1 Tax=Purpureocillium lilacinum TaxID=33203 RepID=A0A2U3E037_PURLI|nr:hypothetical protein PCL_02280 [Purpureocillium lilacinum]
MHHLTTRVRNRPPPPPPPPLPTANRLHSDRGDRERAAHSIPFRRRRRRRPPTTDHRPRTPAQAPLSLVAVVCKVPGAQDRFGCYRQGSKAAKGVLTSPVAVPTSSTVTGRRGTEGGHIEKAFMLANRDSRAIDQQLAGRGEQVSALNHFSTSSDLGHE